MKKKLTENRIKKYARIMLREGEIENAESALAAKDQVDRLQDMVEELSKMNNEELPKLVDKIRGSIGSEQATAYQQAASGVFSELLSAASEKKSALEQAVLVLTGDAQAEVGPKTELGLPDEGEDVVGDEATDFEPEASKTASPLGREPRLPAAESRQFNKKLSEAKIIALKKALDETDSRKFPIRAGRLAEELRRIVTIAIKEEARMLREGKMKVCPTCKGNGPKQARSKTDTSCKTCKGFGKVADNVEESSKTMMKPVAESKKAGKKPTFLVKAEKKAEAKEGKKVAESKSTECKKCGNSLVSHVSKNIGYCKRCAKTEGKMTVPAKKK